ncbi:MAG: hypothetical protein KF893_00830 [Caldilineaceae bacterium]|nr:hypothetical protein [Caldilineaceae bacterium]
MDNATEINVAFPEAENLHLRLTVGACRLRIVPGDGAQWVTGSYEDPSNAVPLRIFEDGNTVRIAQEFNWPANFGTVNRPPTFNLKLGKGKPYLLSVEGGATESEIDLGGVPLRGLTVKYGAGKQEFDFSAPNPEVMESISISAGAAAFEMDRLANANFTRMVLDGGAAAFELDFGGLLARDAYVKINTGMAAVELEIPASTAAKISAEAVLGGVEVGDGFMKKEGAFWNEAALEGKTPVLSVSAQVVMGAIQLKGK